MMQTAQGLHIAFVEEGAAVSNLRDVVHVGGGGGAALPLADRVGVKHPAPKREPRPTILRVLAQPA
nr:MAG TPA: hypothetical protein [Caudoviricetes sp.]